MAFSGVNNPVPVKTTWFILTLRKLFIN